MAIGSVAIEVVPDATAFFARFVAATRGQADNAGREIGRSVRRGLDEELRRPADIKVKADTKQARAEVAALRNDVNRSSGGMIKNLLALAPALVPLGAAAAAAGAEFVALGGTAALAVTGIKREITAASPVGVEFAATIAGMKQSLFQLQAVASRGVLSGFQESATRLRSELPQLSQVVASQSVLLGSVASHLTAGLIGGFQTFEPVLNRVGESVERVAARFEAFATGPGGDKFASALISSFNEAAPVINDLATGIGHIIAAASGTGNIILTEFGAVARAISAIPTPVLSAFITTLAAARIAMLAFKGAAAIGAAFSGVSSGLASLQARYQLAGLQAQAAAAQQAVAAATVEGAVAAEAQFVAEAKLTEVQATLAANEAIIASTGVVAPAFLAEAEAAVAAGRVEVVAMSQTAAIATETALVKAGAAAAAADAQVAAAAAAATAQRTASAGFASMLGPLGLVAGGLLLLPALFGDSGDAAESSAASVRDYTDALVQSSGAINDTVRSKVADSFRGDADEIAKAGLTLKQVVDGVTQGGQVYDAVKAKLNNYRKSSTAATINTAGFNDRLLEQRDRFRDGVAGAAQLNGAVSGLGTTMDIISTSAIRGGTAFGGFASAVTDFLKSSDSVADRGKLIGETLRAANGDAISYQNTINATAKANQQLVTDFVNLKKGVLDLKTGTLDYHNAAAGPVLSDLQALQDANVKAAAAVYQHELASRGGAAAATSAFDVYYKNTHGSLIKIGRDLGLSGGALKRFANEYLGIKNKGDLKKNIQLLGEDKVVEALKGIAALLKRLVDNTPIVTIDANGQPAENTIQGTQRAIDAIRQGYVPGLEVGTGAARDKIAELQALIDRMHGKTVDIITRTRNENGTATSSQHDKGPIARASGGYVTGPGTSTSDSIPARLSNGEFVINADAYSRNKGLVQAINSRAPGFASGGEVGGYTGVDYSGKAGNGSKLNKSGSAKTGSGTEKAAIEYKLIGFGVNGQKFEKLSEARKAAVKAFRAQVNFGVRIDKHDLGVFKASLKKDGSDVRDAFNDTFKDLREIGLKKNSPLAKRLQIENNALVAEVNKRNKIADSLKATQDKYNELSGSVRDAIVGSFDVTSAGTGFAGTSVVSGASIVAQSKQAAARAKLFVKDIKALTGKLNGAYLQDLARKGPDALPQAEALVKLPKADLRVLNQSKVQIGQQASSLAKSVGTTFYGADLTKFAKQLREENTAITQAATKIEGQVRRFVDKADSRPVVLIADGQRIAKIVNTQNAKQKRRH